MESKAIASTLGHRKSNVPPLIVEGLFSYQIGGSERVGVDLALEFSRRGYRVLCFAFYDSDGPMRVELEAAGIECLEFNYQKYSKLTRRVTYQLKFWQMLRQRNVDALHVHHATALILCGIPARLAGVKPVVMTEHGIHQLIDRPDYRRVATRYCRFADEITVVEPLQADYFHKEMGVPAAKLHYVANGVKITERSADKTRTVRAELGIAPGVIAFFYVGRLNEVKDLGTMLRAAALLPPEIRGLVRFYLVGDGPERQSLENLRNSLGLGEVVSFLGVRRDIANVLMAADGFVMSSITEGLPMALLEAMACGVPCVATSVGGIPELFAEERGLLSPPKEPALLADAIAKLAMQPELRARIAANASRRVSECYSLQAVTDQYLALLGLPAHYSP